MSMIELKELVLENFISHKSTAIDMTQLMGLIMIEGLNANGKFDSNGSGKSTIVEGIYYNLTGETLRRMGVNGMINRKVGKDTRTHLKMVQSPGSKEWIVERYRGHQTHGDSILLFEDGQNVSKRLNKETQQEIENLLGMTPRILSNTIILGEGLSSKFTQLSDGDKKSLIESTLNLAYDFNKSRDAANAELKAVQTTLATTRGRITSLENVLTDLDKTALTARIDDLRTKIQFTDQQKTQKNKEYTDLYNEYTSLNTEKTSLVQSRSAYQQLATQENQVMAQVTSLKTLWAQVGPQGECAVCKQSLSSEQSIHDAKAHYMSELQKQGAVLQQIKDQMSQYDTVAIGARLAVLDTEIGQKQSLLQTLMNEVNVLTAELSRMQSELTSSEDLLNNADKYEAEVAQLKDDQKVLEADEVMYKYWYNAFSPTGLLVEVLDEAVEYLNDRLGIYTEMLLDRKYRMKLASGKLSLVDDDGATYESLSNGEKRRLDLAIQFSLHDYVHTYCGIQLDTLFIDEVLDTLDPIGISNIVDVLRIKLTYCNLSRIFIITHNQDLKPYFDRILLVSKGQDEFSTLSVI